MRGVATWAAALAAMWVVGGLLSCGPAASEPARLGDLTVHGPVLVAPPGNSAALYLSVHNRGAEADRLVAFATPLGKAGWHRITREGGRARMVAAPEGFEVPAGVDLRLAPGGDHGMLTGLVEAPQPGVRVPVTLRFARAGELRLEVEVVEHTGG